MRTITIALILTVSSSVLMETSADIRRECRKQSGVSWSALKRLRAADFSQNDGKLKCYLKCFMRKNGIFGEKDIDVEKALRHLPKGVQSSSRKILESCRKIPSSDPCDKAFQIVKCYFEAEPEILRGVAFA